MKNDFGRKGQVTIETLLILAFSITLLIIFLVFSWNQMVISSNAQEKEIAKVALGVLKEEVNDVSYLGEGSKKTFELLLPFEVDSSKSFIESRTIAMYVAGNRAIVQTETDVNGTWPFVSGRTTFEVESKEDFVQVRINPE